MATKQGAKRTYSFGSGRAEGSGAMKELLGGKGAGLAEMSSIGIPVPPGFTITTEVCAAFFRGGKKLPKDLRGAIASALARVEREAGKRFGDAANPLLVSVRSGARVSMPGMMDTVLNLGLNDATVKGLAERSGNERFAWDSYRRFVAMFGDVVLGMKPERKEDRDPFEVVLERKKHEHDVKIDSELPVEALRELVAEFKAEIQARRGVAFPDDPMAQLLMAVDAVFRSWENDRAIAYRRMYGYPSDWGTAVTVQSMVFGNMGEDSGTGVAFTRDPASGANLFYGEFLVNAQGEDVVAGIRTPQKIGEMEARWPDIARQLEGVRHRLESHYRDMQDIEFTIERRRLYVLQTRTGKRTGLAEVKIAVEMADERLITPEEAVLRVIPTSIDQLMKPVFAVDQWKRAVAEGKYLARGLPAGPGAATGRIVFFASDAEEWKRRGETVVLVRHETSPEDIRGMDAAVGFLTAFGGMTSHAALVARQMGKIAVVGCDALTFDYKDRVMTVATAAGPRKLREGDWISVDGFTGEVVEGKVETQPSEVDAVIKGERSEEEAPLYRQYARLLGWADKARTLKVRANADQPDQAEMAVKLGAQGIGLCRTEHMFFGEGKIGPMREMIVAETEGERRAALAKLLPFQRADFAGLFRAMGSRPVTIRTIDPPLHEFLPQDQAGVVDLARAAGKSVAKVHARIDELHESNPMLGHRGCRLGITYPEITEMQARAILEAALDVRADGVMVRPEIMIPLVGARKEFDDQARVVRETAEKVFAERGKRIPFLVGTMIEIPRGALTAGEIAKTAEFFSFGTNDLTQTTFGLSRDDLGPVLSSYVQKDIYAVDPFVTIDRDGVGRLMRIAIEDGRRTKPGLKLGICGEHGGDPSSVEFCHEIGLDYVSCSPYRLPVARLAAAQAALRRRQSEGPMAGKAARKPASQAAPKKAPARRKARKGRTPARTKARAARAAATRRTPGVPR
jgi:pyruvate,orthophosphate dikinase